MPTTRITITSIKYPMPEVDINAELQILGGSLGLFNPRDKDCSKFRIFIVLLKAAKVQRSLSTDDLAGELALTRATVIHHLASLNQAGIVDHISGRYVLRVATLEELVEKIRTDVVRTFAELQGMARKCDRDLGLQ